MQQTDHNELFDLKSITIILMRRKALILWIMSIFVGLGCLYLVLTLPRYTAESSIMIAPYQAGIVSDVSPTHLKASFAQANMESQVAVLASRELAETVAQLVDTPGYENANTQERVARVFPWRKPRYSTSPL